MPEPAAKAEDISLADVEGVHIPEIDGEAPAGQPAEGAEAEPAASPPPEEKPSGEDQKAVEGEAEEELPWSLAKLAEEYYGLPIEEFYSKMGIKLGDRETTLQDLVRDQARRFDYTQKTQALAREEVARRQSWSQANQQWQARLNELDATIQTLLQFGPQKPGEQLLLEDPTQYAIARERHSEWEKQLDGARSARQQAMMQFMAQAHRYNEQYRAAQNMALTRIIPEWGEKPEDGMREMGEIAQFLLGRGFTQEEISGVVDPRTGLNIPGTGLTDARVIALIREHMLLSRKAGEVPEKLAMLQKKKLPPAKLRSGATQGRGAAQQSKALEAIKKASGSADLRRVSAELPDFLVE